MARLLFALFGRFNKGEGKREKGEGRREKGEGRREKAPFGKRAGFWE
jgi:hypothetical protein